jgi:hypothetical protein
LALERQATIAEHVTGSAQIADLELCTLAQRRTLHLDVEAPVQPSLDLLARCRRPELER